MTFNEALRQKKNILRNTSEFTKTLYDYVIIPELEDEGKKYMDELRNASLLFPDDRCKKYSSNARFKIFLLPKSQI
jgi:hypothetical protein